MKNIAICLISGTLVFGGQIGNSQAAKESGEISVSSVGDSVLVKQIDGKAIRVVLSASKIDIGTGATIPRGAKNKLPIH